MNLSDTKVFNYLFRMSVVGLQSASDNMNCSFLQYNQSPQTSLIIGSPNYITIHQVRVYEGIV